jgi:hypothetical protein
MFASAQIRAGASKQVEADATMRSLVAVRKNDIER